MASLPPGSGPPSDVNSPVLPPRGTPFNGAGLDLNAGSSPAPSGPQDNSAKSKRNKRDSRKKREAKGLDTDNQPPPKKKAAFVPNVALPSSDLSILRPLLLAEPRPSDLLPPQPRQLNLVSRTSSEVIGQSWDFYEVVDKLTNKNGFRYSYAIADPEFSHIKYRQTDLYPYHARFSFEDSPAAIHFSKDALAVTTPNPWHSARANVCAREGSYYYEARVISGVVNDGTDPQAAASATNGTAKPLPARGHVRLGFARREADLDVNVGVDCYGYGIRDVNGEVVNRMRCEYFFPKGESIREGDVIGMLITLPPISLHKKVVEGTYDPADDDDDDDDDNDNDNDNHHHHPPGSVNIIRDRIPFHYKSDFCWQQSNVFPTKHLRDYAFNLKDTPGLGPPSPLNQDDPSMRTLPGSAISIFKNGVFMGSPFKDLYSFLPPASRLANGTNNLGLGERENADDGLVGYYPTVSCYGGGAVECRFEAPWWFGPPERAESGGPVRPIGERFTDQIVEDVVADIVDEVEAMAVWGGVDGDVVGGGGGGGGSGGTTTTTTTTNTATGNTATATANTATTTTTTTTAQVDGAGADADPSSSSSSSGAVGGTQVLKGGVGAAFESPLPSRSDDPGAGAGATATGSDAANTPNIDVENTGTPRDDQDVEMEMS